MIFEVPEPPKSYPCVHRDTISTFSTFREKDEKEMKNGGQKVMKIYEKWSLGRPRAEFFELGGRFLMTRKIGGFLMPPCDAQNRKNPTLERPEVVM